MFRGTSSTAFAYLVSIVITAVAVGVRGLLDPLVGDRIPWVTLFGAVAAAVWLGGYGPAIVATIIGYVACDYWFVEPRGAVSPLNVYQLTSLLAYLTTCSIIIGFGEVLRRSRTRARQRHELFRITVASIGDAVITTDLEGRVTLMNAVAESLTGWTQADAAGQPLETIFRIVNEQTRQTVENPAQRALREGTIVGLANHTVLVAKDGVERPIDDSAAPIRDETGRVGGCVLVFRDVSERRQAEAAIRRSEEELADFFENANVGLHWAGPDGKILRVNRAELDLLGYERDEYLGRHIAEFHEDRGVIDGILNRLAAGEVVQNCPSRMLCKDGSVKDVLISSSVSWKDGQFLHTRCFTLDVTDRKRADETQARLAAIVESSDDAIVSKSLEGVIRSWNAGAERIFGYTAAEAVGQPIGLIIPPELQDEERSILERLGRGERVQHFETVRVSKHGKRLHISLTTSPVRNSEGRIIGASKVARDVTERKRADEALHTSEERFRDLANNIDQFVWTCDELGSATWYNRRWYEYTGTTYEEMQGTGWQQVVHPDHLSRVLSGIRACAAQGIPWEDTFPLRAKDGAYRWFLSRSIPIRDESGHVVRWFGTNTDVTQQRQLEEALRDADRRKNEFLATLAHELRNPLAPIRNALEVLKRTDLDLSMLGMSRMVMDRQLSHLVRLVDDLLDVSRISSGKLKLRLEDVELTSVIHHAVETCRPLVSQFNHELSVSIPSQPIHVRGDAVRLAQVFTNLLNNACKYTPPGGRISLEVQQQESEVAVSVTDNGIGIRPEMVPRIFELFGQVERAMERSEGGLGIGLSLVKQFVEMHDGQIEASSGGPGHGSRFVVRLPTLVERSVPPALPSPGTSGDQTSPLRILVVDDNPDGVASLAALLNLMGHQTRMASDGLEAVHAAREFQPQIALLDIGLPKLSGFDVCRQIRKLPWGADTLVVALTGWGQESDRQEARDAGFDEHLVKPVDIDSLKRLLSAKCAASSS